MAKVELKPELNFEELKLKGIKTSKRYGKTYVLQVQVKNTGLDLKENMVKTIENTDFKLYCPYCGSYIIIMNEGLAGLISAINCSNKKCKQIVTTYEILKSNESTVKSYIIENYRPNKKNPVVDPDIEFNRLLKMVNISNS